MNAIIEILVEIKSYMTQAYKKKIFTIRSLYEYKILYIFFYSSCFTPPKLTNSYRKKEKKKTHQRHCPTFSDTFTSVFFFILFEYKVPLIFKKKKEKSKFKHVFFTQFVIIVRKIIDFPMYTTPSFIYR